MGEIRNEHSILVEKREGTRPIVRPRHRWEDNITMYFRETGCKGVDWMHLACGKEPTNEHSGSIRGGE
jgi:hypothetical protein